MAMVHVRSPRRPAVQKIVIPSGTVKPNETVVIEVPSNLKRHAVVVATRPRRPRVEKASEGTGDEQFVSAAYAGDAAAAGQPQDGDQQQQVYDVDAAERTERETLFKNLEAFQQARRNVLQGTRNILQQTYSGLPPDLGVGADTGVDELYYTADDGIGVASADANIDVPAAAPYNAGGADQRSLGASGGWPPPQFASTGMGVQMRHGDDRRPLAPGFPPQSSFYANYHQQ